MKKIVVIGGGAAGAKAASKAKRINTNNYVELFTSSNEIAFSLCGLPYFIEGSVKSIDKLIIRTPEDFRNNGISVFLNHKLQKIFPDKKCVLINDNHIFYDELILALGSYVYLPPIKNINLDNVFTLRTLDSALKIKEKMKTSKKVLVVGAGYIAIELIEAFIKNGLEVILVENKNRIAHDFDEDFSKIIQNIVISNSSNKLETYYGKNVVEFTSLNGANFNSAILSSGEEIFADFCVLCTGVRPNTEIASTCGIKVDSFNAIQVDSKMRTNYSNIYACGDCASKYDIVTHEPCYFALGTIANKEGRVSAINAVGESEEEFDGVLGSTITKFFNYSISKTGLSFYQALEYSKKVNIVPIFATVTKKDKASYMPNVNELTLKLVADKRNGELLGGQVVGHVTNVSQRINTIVQAIKKRATILDVLHLDLPYAPPFSSSVDPILTACYKLREQMDN